MRNSAFILILFFASCGVSKDGAYNDADSVGQTIDLLQAQITFGDSEPFDCDTSTGLRERRVKANRRKYRKGHRLCIQGNTGGYRLAFKIPESAWYPPKINASGLNAEQWNKLGGISMMNFWPFTWGPPNKNALLVGFRPSISTGFFELSAYINNPDKTWEVQILLLAVPDVEGIVDVRNTEGDQWKYMACQGGNFGVQVMTLKPMALQHNIGPWFGGSNKASHTHSVFTEMIFLQSPE